MKASPATVAASSQGEYRSWRYADRATICHRSASRGYGRTLITAVDSPSQQRPRWRLIIRPKATSSMRAPLIAASPPARSRASRRTSIQPPAAAAVRDPGELTRANGYSWAKKYTNAGTTTRSHPVAVRSSASCETRSRSSRSAALTRARSAPRSQAMSASVNSTYPGRGPSAPAAPAAASPWDMAHTLPAQPGGSGAPATTRRTRPGRPGDGPSPAATSAVPSVLQSSTRMTVSAPG